MPPKSRPRPLAELLNHRQSIASLVMRNRYHANIHRHLQRRLPGFLAEHCLACVAHEELLIVFTDSPAWATQLRFTLPGLLAELQKTFEPRWRRIQTKVLCTYEAVPAQRPATVPGGSTIQQIRDAASGCSSPELRASLLRLTATWRKLARGPSAR